MIKLFKSWRKKNQENGIDDFAFPLNSDIKNDINKKYQFKGELLDIFSGNNSDNIIHKWHHYIPIYDRYFSSFKNRPIRFLEIGVSKGGSLEMWRKYFGNDAVIFGIDIDPECKKYDNVFAQVRIGSQDDRNFLSTVVDEMGGVDIILDDGSHRMDHISASLKILFPKLNLGGIYFIEDLHTAYWDGFGGGYKNRNNFFNHLRDIIDDMHNWYHQKGIKNPDISGACTGIHIHDSIVVLEKNQVFAPTHSQVSKQSTQNIKGTI